MDRIIAWRDRVNVAENTRLKGDFSKVTQLVTLGLQELSEHEDLDKCDRFIAQAILGLARIGYVSITAQNKRRENPDHLLIHLTEKIYDSAQSAQNLPVWDINNNPVYFPLEIVQDKANRADSLGETRTAGNLLKAAVKNTPEVPMPSTEYDETSREWAAYLGYLSAMAVIKGRLAKMENYPRYAKESVAQFKKYYKYFPNAERLATLSLWGLAVGIKRGNFQTLTVAGAGFAHAYKDNPDVARDVVKSALKTWTKS